MLLSANYRDWSMDVKPDVPELLFPGEEDVDEEMGLDVEESVTMSDCTVLSLSSLFEPDTFYSLSGDESDDSLFSDINHDQKFKELIPELVIPDFVKEQKKDINPLDSLLHYIVTNCDHMEGKNVTIWDMNNIFKGEAYKDPNIVIDHVLKKKSRIHILVIRYSYAGTLPWFERALSRLSRRITTRGLKKRILIVCPEPNTMTMDNDQAHLLRTSEDMKNEHDKRSQDDIVCWALKQSFSKNPYNAKPRIITEDQDLVNGNVDQMLKLATHFELKYLNHLHQIVNAGTIIPNTLRYLINH